MSGGPVAASGAAPGGGGSPRPEGPSTVGLPALRAAGDGAVLLDCGDLDEALRVLAALTAAREAGELDVDEFVPAAETVLLRGGEAARPGALDAKLASLLAGYGAVDARGDELEQTVISVVYDGADLAEVAEITGMSVDEVVERHTGAQYTVAFTGFAPGFAYLAGGDPRLSVPRRATPRPRIPAGSVGLAGSFSGVYPRESPGGWQLLGRTGQQMWDLGRETPALLQPGGLVRFEAVRERATAAAGPGPRGSASIERVEGTPVLEVVDAGLQTLVEDRGRPGLAAIGVSASGAADRGALARANRLVGNDEGAAALELGFGGFSARATRTAVIALAGAPRRGRITGALGERGVPNDRAFRIDAGELLRLEAPARGLRTMLAVRGGVAATRVLGSASRDTLSGIGPGPLANGDAVLAAEPGSTPVGLPEPTTRPLPAPDETTVLRVIPGPRDDWFDAEGMRRLWQGEWRVTPRSDRVGVRLSGEPLTRASAFRERELPSEGLAVGSIQVPADGQPVLFLVDRPLTGGYPVVGVVCEADLDLAAQLPPGALVRFAPLGADPTTKAGHR